MKKHISVKVLLVCVVILIAGAAARANSPAAGFDKILPFAGADNVRVEMTFRSDEPLTGVEFAGRIVPFKGGAPLWDGTLGRFDVKQGAANVLSQSITGLKPQLWSPSSPTLYDLTVTARRAGRVLDTATIRFGFRSFENRGGQFFLNGKPIFLRGIAINPPGRGIPAPVGESRQFAEDYVRFLKSQNVNTIRLEHDSQIWFDVCDESGMMVYQGVYGSPPESDKTNPPSDFEKSVAGYQKLFETYVRHPAIVIYVLSNEMPYKGQRGAAFTEFLSRAHERLRQWDVTRLYIGNAGYGEGFSGDVRDVHRYWGWYYNTFLTYYNLRDENLFGDPNKLQPFTFTECVGNFTGPRGDYN
ncbi:MAG: glycosyl hydrolase family 2, partial [Acidobacteria bacterium]|nr:glycosyl hydrolase family 2 [Acidobacteriota bacterium]